MLLARTPQHYHILRPRPNIIRHQQHTVAATSHPNILAIFDCGQAGRTAFAVTELLEGETLRARLDAGPIPVRKAIEYAVYIAEGLAAAHDKGIVLRTSS